MMASSLSTDQKKRVDANKKKAMATLAKKKVGKKAQSSMFSFFSPLSGAVKEEKRDTPPSTSSIKSEQDVTTKKLFFNPTPHKKNVKKEPQSLASVKKEPSSPVLKKKPTPPVVTPNKTRNSNSSDDEPIVARSKPTVAKAKAKATSNPKPSVAVKVKQEEQSMNGRRRNRVTSYAEESDSDEDGPIDFGKSIEEKRRETKRLKRTVVAESSDEDEYIPTADDMAIEHEDKAADVNDDAMDVDDDVDDVDDDDDVDALLQVLEDDDDDDDDEPIAQKRTPAKKKPKLAKVESSSSSSSSSSLSAFASGSTPNKNRTTPSKSIVKRTPSSTPRPSTKQGQTEEEESRYPWLANPRDKKKIPHSDPKADKSTLWVPPNPTRRVKGVTKPLSDFETQYWNIKKNWYDTMLFFKKGKFFELYGKDAYIANTELGLKLTDRVNMPMAGVPEKTFTMWATKLLGLGFNVARADELESALAKGMREKKTKTASSSKIIQRSLTTVLTQGTLCGDFLSSDHANFVMSIQEGENRKFGVCFCDVGTNEINITEFEDDLALTQLETLLVQVKPREIIMSKGRLSHGTRRMLKNHTSGAALTVLEPEKEFWNAETTRDKIEMEGYFNKNTNSEVWPGDLQTYREKEEAMSALGGLIFYFKKLLIDEKVISQGRFLEYSPLRHGGTLLLDGQTLQNLEVLENTNDGGTKGTLFELLCHCHTAFGKRKFRKWLCHPLREATDINARYDAVDELESNAELKDDLQILLKSIPDIERTNVQITGSQCRLMNFVTALDAYAAISSTINNLQSHVVGLKSPRLKALLTVGDSFPDIADALEVFKNAFDWEEARGENGKMFPYPGASTEYDEITETISAIEKKLKTYRLGYMKEFNLKLQYYHPGVAKEPYQVPLPVKTKVPSGWEVKSSTSKEKRYWSPEIKKLIVPLTEALETKRQLQVETFKKLQVKFDETMNLWTDVVSNLAEVDCLLSLLRAKDEMGSPTCRPTFLDSGRPTLEFKNIRHPCLTSGSSELVSDFISNDTTLGGATPIATVLTGPNMGGKSTLLRQTCIGVLMAQLGAYIPADSATLTPTDRIFTRIGANDNIIAGRSTFMVELKETATILNMATEKSLVILDELGRGTSTFDGTAIAHATLTHLVDKIGCRALFATHYHSLTDDFKFNPKVSLQHMACQVHESSRDVTFLYQLTPGVCSKSYGLNVAGMAGVPLKIIDTAESTAAKFEAMSRPGFGDGVKSLKFLNLLREIEFSDTMESNALSSLCDAVA